MFVVFPQYTENSHGSMYQYFNKILKFGNGKNITLVDAAPHNYKNILISLNYSPTLISLLLWLGWRIGGWMGQFILFQIIIRRANAGGILAISQEYLPLAHLNNCIVIVHDLIQLKYPRSRIVKFFYEKILPWGLRRVLGVITDSITTKVNLHSMGISSVVVYPYIDNLILRTAESCKKSISMKKNILWIGTLAKHKNLDTFLKAAEICHEYSFTIILPGFDAARFSSKLKNIRVLHNLSSNQIRDEFNQATVFVSTSYDEGYGMPAMEARLAGVPTILSDIPIYRELHQNSAIFYDVENQNQLSNLLKFCNFDNSYKIAPVNEQLKYSASEELGEAIVKYLNH